jgi:ribose transport system permease protein
MSMARGTVLLITQGRSISNFPESFYWFGGGKVFGMPVVPIFIMVLLGIVTHFLLSRTKLGMMTYAIGGNEEATWLSGISTGLFKIYVYVMGGALAGVGGLLLASRLNSAVPTMSTGEEFNAIAAAVIGGTSLMGGEGTIIGTIIGALIMSVVRNGLNLMNVSSYWQVFSIGAIVIIAVLVDQWRPGHRR